MAAGGTPVVSLPVGTALLVLLVTDNLGLTDIDFVSIEVLPFVFPTSTDTPAPSATNTPTETTTSTFTPTFTPSPTDTLAPTSTPTFTPSPTFTLTPTSSFTPTLTPSPTATPTPAVICTATATTASVLVSSINVANGNGASLDTICLTVNGTYTFLSAQNSIALPSITTPITIIGNGAILERGSGAPQFRLFNVTSGGSLTLQNLTVRNFDLSSGNGGALLNAGAVLLSGVTQCHHVTVHPPRHINCSIRSDSHHTWVA